MKQKFSELKALKLYYLFILILTIILVLPTHIFPIPSFMPLRFPHYLEMMKPFLGISWPATFEIYHYVLYALTIIGSLNVLGIIFYPKLRYAVLFSSLIGIFLIIPIILFLFFIFINVNASTAVIYGLYFIVLLIVDLLTFNAIRQKEVSREWF